MRVRTTMAEPDTASARRIAKDLDYLAARLHGRRSRMAEADRLTSLCRIRSLPDFTRTIFPEPELRGLFDFQRLSVHALIRELLGFLVHMSGPGARLLNWILVRFQVENLKVMIRVCLAQSAERDLQEYVVPLPKELALDVKGLSAAESLDDFLRLVPKGLFRESLEEAIEIYGDHPRPFFLEASLDHGYFQGLHANVEGLSREDREIIEPMICQEMDIFHLMLVVRGKFHYGLTPETLLPFHVAGTRIPRALFSAMLHDQDLYASVGRVAERVFDAAPFEHGSNGGSAASAVDCTTLERLAWTRFLRLANLAFRQSHIGLGTVIGYAGIRRVEVANLITLSEGIRKGMVAETIRDRMIARTGMEGIHV